VIGFAGFMLIWAAIGELHGWWAILAMGLVALAIFTQFILELAEVKHLIFGRKELCPRCSGTHSTVTKAKTVTINRT
jgi:hypothetical protein